MLDFKRPLHAKCDDRSRPSKLNETAGRPEDWFGRDVLVNHDLRLLSFDFFVDWSDEPTSLMPRLWVKRLLRDESHQPWPNAERADVQDALERCDGRDRLEALAAFADRYELKAQYMLFKDDQDWSDEEATLLVADLEADGRIPEDGLQSVTLAEVQKVIKHCSGGPVRVGNKGLIYGTSRLECHLSHTDSAWPGDLDGLLVDQSAQPVALLEYKKHTLSSPIEAQQLSNYYPRPDGRKYDRLAVLRDTLDLELPLAVLYYPTRPHFEKVKLEIVRGEPGHLEATREKLHPLPDQQDASTHQALLNTLLEMLA